MTVPCGAGRMISFEGIDGAGKSLHVDRLQALWSQRGQEVVRTREPGGTELAESLRELILHRPMDALSEVLLIFAARRDHIERVIRPALRRGALVLCDRFADATYAYQGWGRGFDLDVLTRLEQWVQGDLQPDLTLWFDVPPGVAAQRLAQARQPDRFEALDEAFFTRVRDGYAARMAQHPARFVRIDGDQGIEQVSDQVLHALSARGWI